jgi:hypothetical protein
VARFAPERAAQLQGAIRHAQAGGRRSHAACLLDRDLLGDVFRCAADLFQTGSRGERSRNSRYKCSCPPVGRAGSRCGTLVRRDVAHRNRTGSGVTMEQAREDETELTHVVLIFAQE